MPGFWFWFWFGLIFHILGVSPLDGTEYDPGLVGWLGCWHPTGCTIPCPHPQLPHRFATKERDGLLLYNGRFNEKHDFVALEVIQEQIQLTFSAGDLGALCPCPSPRGPCLSAPDPKSHTLPAKPGPKTNHEHTVPIPSPQLVSQLTRVLSLGESTTTVSPFVPGGVSDGQWHTVQLKYYNKVGVRGGQGAGGFCPRCSPRPGWYFLQGVGHGTSG